MMRVIAGELRGRRLLGPDGRLTRPITDRAKQSLFDMLKPWADQCAYDIFAGTGSLGIEALSRGSPRALFIEHDPAALRLLRQNLSELGLVGRSRVVAGDAFAAAREVMEPSLELRPGMIFLDPPYPLVRERADDLTKLAERLSRQLAAGGCLIFRHETGDSLDLPGLRRVGLRTHGSMTIELLSCGAE
jgi:16S rRNA (guanine966-N2)-methyltransferase